MSTSSSPAKRVTLYTSLKRLIPCRQAVRCSSLTNKITLLFFSGVFAAAHDLKTEWVVVKGIKDYADGSQPSSDEWRRFASVMAASVVANILSDPVVFEEWSHYNQGNSSCSLLPLYLCTQVEALLRINACSLFDSHFN